MTAAKKTVTKEDRLADPMAEKVAAYDHETNTYVEPAPEDDPKTRRHQVDALLNAVEADQDPRGPVPRRADPFAHQRDASAAEKAAKAAEKERAKAEKAEDNK